MDRVFAWLACTPYQAQNVYHTCDRKGGLFFVHSDHAGPKLLGGVLPIFFTELQIEGRQGVFSENFDAPVESLFRLAPGALFKNAQALGKGRTSLFLFFIGFSCESQQFIDDDWLCFPFEQECSRFSLEKLAQVANHLVGNQDLSS